MSESESSSLEMDDELAFSDHTSPSVDYAALALDDDYLYVFGTGDNGQVHGMTTIWAFNLLAQQWTRVPIQGAAEHYPAKYRLLHNRDPAELIISADPALRYIEPPRDCTKVCSTALPNGQLSFFSHRVLLLDEEEGHICRFFLNMLIRPQESATPFAATRQLLHQVHDVDGTLASFCASYSATGSDYQLAPLAATDRELCFYLLHCDEFQRANHQDQLPSFVTLHVHELSRNADLEWEWRNISNAANARICELEPELMSWLNAQCGDPFVRRSAFAFHQHIAMFGLHSASMHTFPMDKLLLFNTAEKAFCVRQLEPDPTLAAFPWGRVNQRVDAVVGQGDPAKLYWCGGLCLDEEVDRNAQKCEHAVYKELWVLHLDTFRWEYRGMRLPAQPMAQFAAKVSKDESEMYVYGGQPDLLHGMMSSCNRLQRIQLAPASLQVLCARKALQLIKCERQRQLFVRSDLLGLIKFLRSENIK